MILFLAIRVQGPQPLPGSGVSPEIPFFPFAAAGGSQIKHKKMTKTQHTETTQNQPATLQEQLHIILAASSDGIALINANNHIIEANNTFSELFGIHPSQLIDMDCINLLYHKNNHA